MDDAAVIQGSYSDLKLIKTRKVGQIIIEVPIERVPELIAKFGMPDYGAEVPVVVARMATEKELLDGLDEMANPKPKSYAQRAGILSNDHAFWQFINETHGPTWHVDTKVATEGHAVDWAADFIREHCGIRSRRDILEGTEAGRRFLDLEAEFKAWKLVA